MASSAPLPHPIFPAAHTPVPRQARIIMGQDLQIRRYIMTATSTGQGAAPQMTFTLPPLPYAFDALMPHIDAKTMEIHHDKHHAAYVTNANKALEGTKWAEMDPVDVIKQLGDVPEDKRAATRNNVGGHVNHSMFWKLMAAPGKGGGGEPTGDVAKAITTAFGTFAHSKEEFAKA